MTVTTRGPDILPSTGSLTFGTVTGLEISTWATSPQLTLAGIETGVMASISTGRLDIYSGGVWIYSGNNLPVSVGNSIKANVQSSSEYGTSVT